MTETIYQPPIAELEVLRPVDRKRGRALAITGLLLFSLPLLGLLASMVWMSQIFATLASTGQASPEVLASQISAMMLPMIFASVAGIVGGVICLVVVFGAGNREKWFRAWGLTLALLNLCVLPLGTLFGLVLIVALILRWKEFGAASSLDEVAFPKLQS
ncbi:MAG: hypothetical protein ACQKBU_04455 [Verrucomicrobiales bacterium]